MPSLKSGKCSHYHHFSAVLNWGLRKYSGLTGEQFGLEPTLELYIEHSMAVLDECWRVLRKDGTCWWNLGDSYCAGTRATNAEIETIAGKNRGQPLEQRNQASGQLKNKDLCLVPFRFALAAQARGWWIRSDIIWAKPNPMPESVTDRPTDAYEHIFLMTKNGKYWYDAEAVREKISQSYADDKRPHGVLRQRFYENSSYVKAGMVKAGDGPFPEGERATGRNLRNVWQFATEAFPSYLRDTGSHFACFPEELPRRCILAGCPEKTCAKCGAGWVRILEKERGEPQGIIRADKAMDVEGNPMYRGGTSQSGLADNAFYQTKTLGWKPSCECGTEETERGICLDPFAGSGTVVDVAIRCGRRGIGIELSGEYIKLAQKRTENSRKQQTLL